MDLRDGNGGKPPPPRLSTGPQAATRRVPAVKKGEAQSASGPKGKTPKGTNSQASTPPGSAPVATPDCRTPISCGSAGVSSPRPPGLLGRPKGDQSRGGTRAGSVSPAPSTPSTRSSRPGLAAAARADRAGLAGTDPPPPTRERETRSQRHSWISAPEFHGCCLNPRNQVAGVVRRGSTRRCRLLRGIPPTRRSTDPRKARVCHRRSS